MGMECTGGHVALAGYKPAEVRPGGTDHLRCPDCHGHLVYDHDGGKLRQPDEGEAAVFKPEYGIQRPWTPKG